MITDTWASKGLGVSISNATDEKPPAPASTSASAQLSDDGKVVYVRVAVNIASTVVLQFNGKPVSGSVKHTKISGKPTDANSPGNPKFISPTTGIADCGLDGS